MKANRGNPVKGIFRANGLLFGIMLLLMIGSVNAENPFVLEIPEEVVLSGSRFNLDDLGKVSGGSAADRKLLGKIQLGTVPSPGQVRVFSRKYLQLLLTGYRFNQSLTLKMGEQVSVKPEAVCISGLQLQTAVNRLITAGHPGVMKRWVELRNVPDATWLPKRNWEIDAAPIGEIPLIGSAVFKVTIGTANERKTINISGNIRAKAYVYRAKRDLPRFAIIGEEQLERVVMEIKTGREFLKKLPGRPRTLGLIRAGDVIEETDIQEAPLVTKGNEVVVSVKEGDFEIRMTGTACSDGWLGDRIKLLNPISKKLFSGRVIGVEMVEVTVR